jgi:ferric-dicitrate binding protein FerR (iron transport regulator)
MSPDNERIRILFERYYNKAASHEERRELMEWIDAGGNEEELSALVEKAWEELNEKESFFTEKESAIMKGRIIQTSKEEAGAVSMFSRPWFKWAAAAAVLVIVLAGSYRLLFHQRAGSQETAAVSPIVKDIPAPQSNRAMIKLADGKFIYLDSVQEGTLASQEAVKLVKLGNGAIAYEKTEAVSMDHPVYNTLINPRGSQVIHIKLADGSTVWLNAGSSLTYPLAFVGNTREISLQGEGYFEVSHDASRPFVVSSGETRVQVLGTHFNINAYSDEPDMKVTLLEGAVLVSHAGAVQRLQPGEQAIVKEGIRLGQHADLDAVMAWKNGRFAFNSADIAGIMRQVARWYDVDVKIEGQVDETFSGSPPRTANISELLKILEATSKIKYELNGKRLTIYAK